MRPTIQSLPLSIFLILLVNVSGLIGILIGYADFFIRLSPMALLLNFVLIVLAMVPISWRVMLALISCYVLGFAAEYVGVNHGLLFGEYSYGENLGPKLWGVPYIIGINWISLTYATAGIARLFTANRFLAATLASLLMVAVDIPIEMAAPRFDYWEFAGGVAPFQNYLGWFAVSLLIQSIYLPLVKSENRYLSLTLYGVILLFFSIFVWIGS